MTDWRDLPSNVRFLFDVEIVETIPNKHHIAPDGFEFDEPYWTLENVHMGHYCAYCWMPEYSCLCSYDD